MAYRAFKEFTITAGGTPQPLVGTFVTATTSPATPGPSGDSLTTLPVNDSSMFLPGDWAYLVDAAHTVAKKERLWVQSVPNGTSITVKNMQLTRTGGAFGTGDFVVFGNAINSIIVQEVAANTAILFIGMEGMAKAGFVKVIYTLTNAATGQQPAFQDERHYGPDVDNASEFWIDGTTGDGYIPSFGVA